jgi:hypothetical protein
MLATIALGAAQVRFRVVSTVLTCKLFGLSGVSIDQDCLPFVVSFGCC